MKTVFHRLKPVREVAPGYWKLRWRPIKHQGWRNDQYSTDLDGTYNIYTSKHYDYKYVGIQFSYSRQCGISQYGRRCRSFSITLQLWSRSVEFWVKWDFHASTSKHGDNVEGIDIPEKGVE